MSDPMVWFSIAYFVFMAITLVWFVFWALPAVGRWLALPPDDPRPEQEYPDGTIFHDLTELHQAVYDFRLAINGELDRLFRWLSGLVHRA